MGQIETPLVMEEVVQMQGQGQVQVLPSQVSECNPTGSGMDLQMACAHSHGRHGGHVPHPDWHTG